MDRPTATSGNAATSTKQAQACTHSVTARLAPDGLTLGVESPDRWVIVATVAFLITGFMGTIAVLALILR